ncbi:Cyclic nucleotide-binding protein [Pseudocohnilembus persalinus]|uniref:Cyclic nucleotide-binding protein n=1 Tax=Pseudocohnilembus persalinus TaxID=266149 RepID=A0A0V0QR20_PSEPJ|nr:Cyclic nucleotide-binding protein [Pseudocohnilembus persalinus]|eukprot:KRX04652.1 Cyclic nucleotide-binding protein [Pseudocohnilembus persalinus]
MLMQEKIYGPQEFIYKKGQIDSRLIFIAKGDAEIMYERIFFSSTHQSYASKFKNSKIFRVGKLTLNEWVGLQSILKPEKKSHTLQCQTMTHIYYLTDQDFQHVLKQFPHEYYINSYTYQFKQSKSLFIKNQIQFSH